MYFVTIQNNGIDCPIHDQHEKLKSGKITKGINTIDSFSFTILPSNVGFSQLREFQTLVKVYNSNKNRYDFQGRVLCINQSMSESGLITREVTCESYLAFLCDSIQTYISERNWTVRGLLARLINVHNLQVEDNKKFVLGEITVTDPNDNLYCGIQYKSTWDMIKEKLIDKLGGELQFRVVDGVMYLDYLAEIGETKTTEIAMSKNMKAITKEKDPSAYVTRLVPLGAKLNDSEDRLTIESVNNGKIYVDDEQAIAEYGIHVGTVEFDDVTEASNLLSKGQKWLIDNNKVQIKYSVTALDLSLLGQDLDDFDVCNRYPLKNPLLGIDDTARIIKKNIDICEEVKSTIEFGESFKSLTELQNEQTAKLAQAAESVLKIQGDYVTTGTFTKELSGKVGVEENDRIVSMINASSEIISITANRLMISSDHFTLDADGTVSAARGVIGSDATYAWHIGTSTSNAALYSLTDSIALSGGLGVATNAMYIGTDGISCSIGDSTSKSDYTTVIRSGLVLCYGDPSGFGDDNRATRMGSAGLHFYSLGSTKVSETSSSSVMNNGEIAAIEIPNLSDYVYLSGTWKSASAISTSSDRNAKNSIESIDDRYGEVFDRLSPKRFKYNNGTSNRYHVGFIAQEVKEAMDEAGVNESEFAALCYSNLGTENESWSLRYEEFIALLVGQVQKLKSRIETLENIIKE